MMTINIRCKVEESEGAAIITVEAAGHETVKRETGERAAALLTALRSADKLGVWLGSAPLRSANKLGSQPGDRQSSLTARK